MLIDFEVEWIRGVYDKIFLLEFEDMELVRLVFYFFLDFVYDFVVIWEEVEVKEGKVSFFSRNFSKYFMRIWVICIC